MLNDKILMTQLVTAEQRVPTGSLHIVTNVHSFFTRHKLEWMAWIEGAYSKEVVRDFYASYLVNLRGSLDRQGNSAKKDPLTGVLVRGRWVDISPTTFYRFLSGCPLAL